jgi:hypothetical protein
MPEIGSNSVRILLPQPPSVATPPDFRIEKIVPSFRPVGRSLRLTEHEVMPIRSKVLPISEAGLRTPMFDFLISRETLLETGLMSAETG